MRWSVISIPAVDCGCDPQSHCYGSPAYHRSVLLNQSAAVGITRSAQRMFNLSLSLWLETITTKTPIILNLIPNYGSTNRCGGSSLARDATRDLVYHQFM